MKMEPIVSSETSAIRIQTPGNYPKRNKLQNGSTLKVMEEFNIQGKQTSFYKYCPGTFGYTLVCTVEVINVAFIRGSL